ncbi:hypothetical protein bcere0010_23790 [Bacillus cereus ATCC 4342]|nr:hypothetical protein bcere0010_23790 [Bacillus cereus ATCC 4342]
MHLLIIDKVQGDAIYGFYLTSFTNWPRPRSIRVIDTG